MALTVVTVLVTETSFHQVTAECGKIECIMRNCSRSGPTKFHLSVLEANPGLEENNNTIQWNRWIFVEKFPGVKAKKLVLNTFHGTRKELLDSFLEDLVLDNNYLSMGSNSLRIEGSYSEQYALFSGQYAHGNIEDIIESVYEKEMLEMSQKNTHMGMWQIWASTNVIGRPIMSIFPDRGSPAFRSDFNRLCVPYLAQLRKKEPIYIMWTPTVHHRPIQHFVPLLKK